MATRKTILDDGWALIADADEITVGQRDAMYDAVAASSAAGYRLNSLRRVKQLELEKSLTAEERKAEKEIDAEARATIEAWRAQVAEMMAYRELDKTDQDDIARYQRVSVRCYLRGWWKEEDIPKSDEDFDALPGSLFDALYAACGDTVPDVPDVAATPDNLADPKAGQPA